MGTVIAVTTVLNRIKAEDLVTLEPFYVTNIGIESGERGRKASVDDPMGEMYTFDIVDVDGTFIGSTKTASLGLMEQIDGFLKLGGHDDRFGPVKVATVGKSRRFVDPGFVPATLPLNA